MSVSVSLSVSVREHISRTTCPRLTNFCACNRYSRGSDLQLVAALRHVMSISPELALHLVLLTFFIETARIVCGAGFV